MGPQDPGGIRSERARVPAAMAFVFCGGREVVLSGISREGFTVETDGVLAGAAEFTFHLYDLERHGYERFRAGPCRIVRETRTAHATAYDVSWGAAGSAPVRALLDRIEHLKLAWYGKKAFLDARRARLLLDDILEDPLRPSGAPAEEPSPAFRTYEEQRAAWFDIRVGPGETRRFRALRPRFELALSFQDEPGYEACLGGPVVRAAGAVLARCGLDGHGLFARPPSRIYLGNEFCPFLFPSESTLLAIAERCAGEGLDVTVAVPALPLDAWDRVAASLETLHRWSLRRGRKTELVINDWGLLHALAREPREGFALLLGRLLNKRTKDPRAATWARARPHASLLQENALNHGPYRRFLRGLGIERFEFESHGAGNRIPPGRHSLHLPFYQISTGKFCLLHAACAHGSREVQRPVSACPRHCRSWCMLYPGELQAVMKGNTVFGFHGAVLRDPSLVSSCLDAGIDRMVFSLV